MIELVKARLEDLPIIQSIAEKTWPTTYGSILSAAQITTMLKCFYAIDVLEKCHAEQSEFIIAYHQNKPVAFCAFEPYDKENHIYKLQKLYAIPQNQKLGIGQKLIQAAQKRCIKLGAKKLILNVNRYNSAYLFYLKMKFDIIESIDVPIGNGYFMNDYVMGKIL